MTYDFDDFLVCSPEELAILERIANGEIIENCPITDTLKDRNLLDDYHGKPMMAAMVWNLWEKFKKDRL